MRLMLSSLFVCLLLVKKRNVWNRSELFRPSVACLFPIRSSTITIVMIFSIMCLNHLWSQCVIKLTKANGYFIWEILSGLLYPLSVMIIIITFRHTDDRQYFFFESKFYSLLSYTHKLRKYTYENSLTTWTKFIFIIWASIFSCNSESNLDK